MRELQELDAIQRACPLPPADWSRWCLFLDLDGTLLDFAPAPELVRVEAGLRTDLERLGRHLNGALALLSGRPLAQLDALLGWAGRPAAGLHGAELRLPDGRLVTAGDARALDVVRRRAALLLAAPASAGIWLEDKQGALALHYGGPEQQAAAAHVAQQLQRVAGPRYALQRGHHVIELKPAAADKGRALTRLLASAPFAGRRPWVLGDDLTDEDAFVAAQAAAGVGVVVGARRPSAARYALPQPLAARRWLQRLAARGTEPTP